MSVRLLSAMVFASVMAMVLQAQTHLTIDTPSPDIVVFTISNSHYGSLEFDGSIERADMGDEWEFRTHLFATFHANTKPNQTTRVDVNRFEFVATNPRHDGIKGPSQLVAKHDEPIELRLDVDGERKPIPGVSFRVLKEVIAPAEFTGISVFHTLGMAWPIPTLVNLADPTFGRPRR